MESVTPPPVSWASLPHKGQLAVIVLARLAEPLSERSLTSYLFYQLRWFRPDLDTAAIARQAGYLTAIFAAAQCLTSMWWGRAADHPRIGRKRVIVMGLIGSSVSALGMGFSTSLPAAFAFRFLAGSLNGNVGVLRTMVSEVVGEKRFQPRAFLLLPMCFNVGVIVGPLLSGFLADPVHSLPRLFGPGSWLGGVDGVAWLRAFPYALPNLFCASVLSSAAIGVLLGLDETHPQLRSRPDAARRLGRRLSRYFKRLVLRKKGSPDSDSDSDSAYDYDYTALNTDADEPDETDDADEADERDDADGRESQRHAKAKPPSTPAPFRAVLTRKVCLNLLQRFLQTLHVAAFNAIFFTLLPMPRADPRSFQLPWRFSGGLGLSSEAMGLANTTLGVIGLPLQLLLYPRLVGRLGVRSAYRLFLPLSIVAYFALPWLVLLSGVVDAGPVAVWTGIAGVLALHILSRTFVTPATLLLINDSAPRPDLLGTVHGLTSSVSSAARILAPISGGLLLSWGLAHNLVGLPLWLLGVISLANWSILWWIDDVQLS